MANRREYMKAWHAKNPRPNRPHAPLTAETKAKAQAYARSKYNTRIAAGLCVDCPKSAQRPAAEGFVRCADHRATQQRGSAVYNERKRPEQRWKTIQKKYGITRAEWEAIFAAQGSCCGTCGSKDPRGNWQTDHDHAIERAEGRIVVRWVLCTLCNFVLGAVGDDPARLERIATKVREYLRARLRVAQ